MSRGELTGEPLCHLPVRQSHCGQAGIEVRGDEGEVVEADDGEVRGDGDPQARRLSEDTSGEGVVVAEDGGGALGPVKEPAGDGVDAVRIKPTDDDE